MASELLVKLSKGMSGSSIWHRLRTLKSASELDDAAVSLLPIARTDCPSFPLRPPVSIEEIESTIDAPSKDDDSEGEPDVVDDEPISSPSICSIEVSFSSIATSGVGTCSFSICAIELTDVKIDRGVSTTSILSSDFVSSSTELVDLGLESF